MFRSEVDVVGLRALAEKALGKYELSKESYGATSAIEDLLAEVVRAVPDVTVEITTLRAEVADRGARIKAALEEIGDPGSEPANPFMWNPWEDGSVDPSNTDDVVREAASRGWDKGRWEVRENVHRILSDLAVPVPQDNPEATRGDIADEISGVQVGHGYESTTIGITAALEAADLIKAAFDVRPKNGEKP